MPQLLIAILLLGLGWYGIKFFARASPVAVARIVRFGGGALAGLVGLVLLLRGRPDLGIAGIGAGLWLSGFFRLPGKGAFRAATRRATGRSQVRSATLEMELDHSSGTMRGTIVAGPQRGRPLEMLTRPECVEFYRWCLGDDPEGARLLEAYMDRRFPGWSQTSQAQRDPGSGGRAARPGLSEEQAYQILGLGKSATRDDVTRAHRALMKKFHPDYGGTTDVAARVNEAREVLMRRFD